LFQVGEAYSILSDAEKKKLYDQFGEEGLKGGPMPGYGGDFGGRGGTTFHTFSNADAFNLFEHFFADMGGGMGGMGGSSRGGARMGGFGGMGGMPSMFGGGSRGGFHMFDGSGMMDTDSSYSEPEKAPDVVLELKLTLEELAVGLTKKMRVNRTITDEQGRSTKDIRTVEIPIKAGYKEGTKIRYEGYGDKTPHSTQDLVFIIKQKPHDKFTREGDDLVCTVDLTLSDALTGTKITLPSFAGRAPLTVDLKDPISPSYVHTFRGQGMPNSKLKTTGDLKVKFNILFPTQLSSSDKEKLKTILQPLTYKKK
jgi:DnaJ family protein B protein 4